MSFINNPKTSRPIKVGGRTYNKLISEGVIKMNDSIKKDEKVLFTLEEDQTKQHLNVAKEVLRENYKDDEYTVSKGKGKYKNSIVKTRKRINREDYIDKLTKVIYNIVNEDDEFIDELREYDKDELKNYITDLIIG